MSWEHRVEGLSLICVAGAGGCRRACCAEEGLVLVHVLRAGLHAGRCDPGWCLSVQILRIPGKPSTFCYQSVVCVFHRFPCAQKRSVCLNQTALLLSFLSLESFSLSTGKVHGLFCQQRRAGPSWQIKRNNSFENLTENGLYLNIGLEYKNPSGVPDFHPLFLTFSTCQALKVA